MGSSPNGALTSDPVCIMDTPVFVHDRTKQRLTEKAGCAFVRFFAFLPFYRGAHDREAHLATIEDCPQTPAWLSRPHGHQRRTQGLERAPRAWPAAPGRLRSQRAMARIERLIKRADFLRSAQGKRWNSGSFALQMIANGEESTSRLGFTVSRKNGNAVKRNRIKRRLKAALGQQSDDAFIAGHDYVIVARPKALTMPFADLREEIGRAFQGLRRASRNQHRETQTLRRDDPAADHPQSANPQFKKPR
jgi:ribonuclease P protein component